jgi:transposase
MISDPSTLPDDPVELKKIIAQINAEHASQCQQLESRYQQEIELLHEQMRTLYDHLFGRKSEKHFGGNPQLLLFDMPEVDPEPELAEKVIVPSHARKKPGRKPLPENLPRVEVIHDIDESEKQCQWTPSFTKLADIKFYDFCPFNFAWLEGARRATRGRARSLLF